MSEGALSVTLCILAALPTCEHNSKLRCLELLGQIVVSKPKLQGSNVLNECIDELYGISWYLLNAIEYGDPRHIWLYVDLIGILGLKNKKFKEKAIVYLSNSLNREGVPQSDLVMIKNTLDEINSYWGQIPLR